MERPQHRPQEVKVGDENVSDLVREGRVPGFTNVKVGDKREVMISIPPKGIIPGETIAQYFVGNWWFRTKAGVDLGPASTVFVEPAVASEIAQAVDIALKKQENDKRKEQV